MADISKFCLLLLLRNLDMRVHLSTDHFSVEYNTLVVVFDGNNRQTRSYQRIKRTGAYTVHLYDGQRKLLPQSH